MYKSCIQKLPFILFKVLFHSGFYELRTGSRQLKVRHSELDIAIAFVKGQTENAEGTGTFVGDIRMFEIGCIAYSGCGL